MPKIPVQLAPTTIRSAIRSFNAGTKKRVILTDGRSHLSLVLERRSNGDTYAYWRFRVQKSKSWPHPELLLTLKGLGPDDLALARERRDEFDAMIAQGKNPKEELERAEKRAQAEQEEARKAAFTFRDAAEKWLEECVKDEKWRSNGQGERKARSLLRLHILPVIEREPIQSLSWREVEAVMRNNNLLRDHPDLAKKARTLIDEVCGWAVRANYRPDVIPPAVMQGPLKQATKSLRDNQPEREHRGSLAPNEVPAFVAELRRIKCTSARALEFLIYTASRPGPLCYDKNDKRVNGARWEQFDLENRIWHVPADNMKAGASFDCFLSSAAVDLLRSLPRDESIPWVFPSDKKNGERPLTTAALTQCIDKMSKRRVVVGLEPWLDKEQTRKLGKPVKVNPHGFRASFRSWCTTDEHRNDLRFNREAAEISLSHVVGDEYGGAYNRPNPKDMRWQIAEYWGIFCQTGKWPDEVDAERTHTKGE